MSTAGAGASWQTRRMPPAKISAAAALLGGVLWVLRALLGGGDDPLSSTLHFVGLACVMVSAALFGSTLVRSGATGMRVVVGLASGLFALSMIEAFRTSDSAWYDGAWGIVIGLLGGLALLRGRGEPSARPSAGGTHSR